MRKIKYYDRINHKMLELEVNDKVAKFLQADDRRQSRKGQKYRENVVLSLDEYSQVDGQNYLTYHELIADEKSNTIDNYENKQFNKLVWKIAHRLPRMEGQILWWYYKIGHKASDIAKCLKKDNSQFSQQKVTALSHLRNLLTCDEEFRNTDYYINSVFRDFKNKIYETAQKLEPNKLKINLYDLLELTKQVPQVLKVNSKLGIKLNEDDKQKSLLANNEVKKLAKWFIDNNLEFDLSNPAGLLNNIIKYALDTYNEDKDKRFLAKFKTSSPNLYGILNHKDYIVKQCKPFYLIQYKKKHNIKRDKPKHKFVKKKNSRRMRRKHNAKVMAFVSKS